MAQCLSTSNIPIGFKFCPTNEELVKHFLKPKIARNNPEVDDCSFLTTITGNCNLHPSTLTLLCSKSKPWNDVNSNGCYFYYTWSSYGKGNGYHRTTENGVWCNTGRDAEIKDSETKTCIGKRSLFTFYNHERCVNNKTDYVMHVIKLVGHRSNQTVCQLKKKKVYTDAISIHGTPSHSAVSAFENPSTPFITPSQLKKNSNKTKKKKVNKDSISVHGTPSHGAASGFENPSTPFITPSQMDPKSENAYNPKSESAPDLKDGGSVNGDTQLEASFHEEEKSTNDFVDGLIIDNPDQMCNYVYHQSLEESITEDESRDLLDYADKIPDFGQKRSYLRDSPAGSDNAEGSNSQDGLKIVAHMGIPKLQMQTSASSQHFVEEQNVNPTSDPLFKNKSWGDSDTRPVLTLQSGRSDIREIITLQSGSAEECDSWKDIQSLGHRILVAEKGNVQRRLESACSSLAGTCSSSITSFVKTSPGSCRCRCHCHSRSELEDRRKVFVGFCVFVFIISFLLTKLDAYLSGY